MLATYDTINVFWLTYEITDWNKLYLSYNDMYIQYTETELTSCSHILNKKKTTGNNIYCHASEVIYYNAKR